MNPAQVEELEEERRFLLRSLGDLEREHEAGDVDEGDYVHLRDGYVVRAAATLRAISEGRSQPEVRIIVSWRRRLLGAVVAIALVGIVSWVLAVTSAERLPGQQMTGADPRDQRTLLMAQARALQFETPADAAELYSQVLELDPVDVEALTYRGWTLALASRTETDQAVVAELLDASVKSLIMAIETDPSYPDPYCFLGIVQFRFVGDATVALPLVDGCLASNPPADVRGLVESMRDSIVVAIDESSAGA